MAARIFETKEAHYVLQLQDHETGVGGDPALFEFTDALVLENTTDPLSQIVNSNRADYEPFISQAMGNGIPLYGVDVSIEGVLGSRGSLTTQKLFRSMIGALGIDLVSDLILDRYSSPRVEIPNLAASATSFLSFISQIPIVEARDALNAQKIIEFVVPRANTTTNKAKPTIGLLYGPQHIGLESNLRSPLRRKVTLLNWEYLNFGRWRGLERSTLNRAYESRHNKSTDRWDHQEYNLNLFRDKGWIFED